MSEIPNETPKERGVRKALTGEKSEFGEGVVIPLVYFAAHFDNDQATRIKIVSDWMALGRPPVTTLPAKYGRTFFDVVNHFLAMVNTQGGSEDKAMASWITTHMNGASDHLYGLQIPDSFPAELKAKMEALRETALKMGHGFDGTTWTPADFDSLWEMTKAVALDIDRQVLGIDDADEGEHD